MPTQLQEKFNNSIIQALLFNNMSLCEKERKLQQFVSENEERYEFFCENIYQLFANIDTNSEADTLYMTIDGFSFISNSTIDQHLTCCPVLTISKYSPKFHDISAYIEIALNQFASYCEFAKNAILTFNKSA